VDGLFHLQIDQAFVTAFCEESGEAALDVKPGFAARDELLIGLAQMVFADLSGPAAPSRLVWDTYASAIVLRLLRSARAPVPASARGGGLAPFQLRRVLDYLHANLAADVGLAELAHLAGLSSKHFARAFKQSTGLPPHRWLMNQRLDMARDLLARGDLGIAEVAVVCGFADQSHFTAACRKSVGVTPGAYRRQVRR
jgi:transcriptional regulator GlxA family with amidase domain